MISRERLIHRKRIGKRMTKRFYVWGCDDMDVEEAKSKPLPSRYHPKGMKDISRTTMVWAPCWRSFAIWPSLSRSRS